jgi:hypothetical protein
MRVVRTKDGRIDWWGVFVYVAIFGALIYALNDVTGVVKTPAERRIETRVIERVVNTPTLRGPRGATGSVGPKGATGDKGATGPRGPTGRSGAVGPPGARGPRGHTGPVGPQGSIGTPGVAGQPGTQGAAGPQGIPGLPGVAPSVQQLLDAICAQSPLC